MLINDDYQSDLEVKGISVLLRISNVDNPFLSQHNAVCSWHLKPEFISCISNTSLSYNCSM